MNEWETVDVTMTVLVPGGTPDARIARTIETAAGDALERVGYKLVSRTVRVNRVPFGATQ